MKRIYFIILLIFLTANSNSTFCQSFTFIAETVDKVYWKETSYMCSISPLSSLTGYKSVYKELSDCEVDFDRPVFKDKNYTAYWTIIGNRLYLYDVDYLCAFDNDSKCNLVNIEKFINTKFSKKNLSESDRKDEHLKNGVIPAVWFTGTLYIKRDPNKGEHFWKNEYRNEKFTRLVFDKGHLIEEKTVSNMNE
jgi:hypothetical protein